MNMWHGNHFRGCARPGHVEMWVDDTANDIDKCGAHSGSLQLGTVDSGC